MENILSNTVENAENISSADNAETTAMPAHTEEKPLILPLMSLREVVVFPRSITPLFVGRAASIKAIEQALSLYNKQIFLVAQREPEKECPEVDELFPMGTVCKILQLLRLPDGNIKVLFEGLYRARWKALEQNSAEIVAEEGEEGDASRENAAPHLSVLPLSYGAEPRAEEHAGEGANGAEPAEPAAGSVHFADAAELAAPAPQADTEYPLVAVEKVVEVESKGMEVTALIRATRAALQEFVKISKRIAPEVLSAIMLATAAGKMSDSILPHLRVEYRKKQGLLEELNTALRLEQTLALVQNEIDIASMERSIKSRVKGQMDKNQRDYYLNEKIKAIHKELGQDEAPQAELDELCALADSKKLSDEAREKVMRELKRLRQMSPASSEYSVSRNYVDWILDLPWGDLKETQIDIDEARRILDADHYGLEKPKERILEFLAVQKLVNTLTGPILCLVGPPGVGKTSLARSVAKATGRDFVRLSLGGVRDEAEIRGHRRTYIGALPGKIIQSLKRAKHNNPLFCLDEIDKMSTDFRGDPASALLEVLDPEQNNCFVDHYLDMDYDLSKVFFITTANSLHSIPLPLQDRMEIIQLSGYLETEKKHIAQEFLIPRQQKKHGLSDKTMKFSDNVIPEIIRSYTREAGVRSLEREIATVCRKTAMQLVEKNNKKQHITVSCQNIGKLLGIKRFHHDSKEQKPQVGVVTGLAWTEVGGELLVVETALMPGTGQIVITGQLGDVMQESARAALSYVRSQCERFGLRSNFHKEIDIHVHVPAGATPKDGPSAGITLASCMVSALLGIPARDDVAMTGEITLRGRVLPIGGLREKLLAAQRGHIRTVLIPQENTKDLSEIPAEVLKGLTIIPVEHINEVLPHILQASAEEIFSGDADSLPLAFSLRKKAEEVATERAQ